MYLTGGAYLLVTYYGLVTYHLLNMDCLADGHVPGCGDSGGKENAGDEGG